MTFLGLYLMGFACCLGVFIGSAIETPDKPTPGIWVCLTLIALAWPWVLVTSIAERRKVK